MKNSFVVSFLFLSGILFISKVQETTSVSENYVRIFLQRYNYYMAILRRLSAEIGWELEMGGVKGQKRKKATLIANKAAKYIRTMNNKADKLYETVKKSSTKISEDMRRQLMLINQVGTPKDLKHIVMTNKVLKIMSKIYSSARV